MSDLVLKSSHRTDFEIDRTYVRALVIAEFASTYFTLALVEPLLLLLGLDDPLSVNVLLIEFSTCDVCAFLSQYLFVFFSSAARASE